MVCSKCKKENKNTNIRCEFCNTELVNLDNISNPKREEITLQQKLCMLCFFVTSGAMIVYGLFAICSSVYSFILENKIKSEYNQTYATLVEYTDCEVDEDNNEVCNAIYKYEVNNNTYTVSLDLEVVRDVYQNSEIVYYNPDNPNKSVIYADTEKDIVRIFGIISGIVMICVAIFIILFTVSVYKTLKESKKVV